jgi:phosphoglycolate phosphatase-like HAD superfamily hydrolase
MKLMHKLILWDIDGTLLYSGGVAGEAMREAMQQVYGALPSDDRRSYAGKTDQQIILETFADQPPELLLSALDRFEAAYIAILGERRAEFLARGTLLPGIPQIVARLAEEPVVQSLLTGNLRLVAAFKLGLHSLVSRFDMDSGAYGSDHARRVMLPGIAAARAEQRYGRPFRGADVVVIGDTPNDIACGKAFGARTVAVATGPFTPDELRAHAPDAVLADCSDTEAAFAAILG